MPFLEHLRELRDRLRKAVIALVIGFCVAYAFHEEIYVWLLQPLLQIWESKRGLVPIVHYAFPDWPLPDADIGPPQLHFGSLVEPFWTYFSIAFWAGIFVAAPFIFHQLWGFISPGLYSHEKRMAVPFAAISAIFFVGGAVFCYYMVLPYGFEWFMGFSDSNLSSMQSVAGEYSIGIDVALKPTLFMRDYLDLAKKLLIGFGLIFELPLLIAFLAKVGLVTHRSLWKFNRWAIVLSFVFAAILTPPDPVSQCMMAGPLIVLYNGSIIVAFFITKGKERRAAAIDRGET